MLQCFDDRHDCWDGTSAIALLGVASDDRAALRDPYEKLRNTNVCARRRKENKGDVCYITS